jgi:hypothetical protein
MENQVGGAFLNGSPQGRAIGKFSGVHADALHDQGQEMANGRLFINHVTEWIGVRRR